QLFRAQSMSVESERAARAEAERANRAKMEFLATMSHELRTPLNAIGGYADLLEMELHGPINDAQRQDIERLRRSQRALVRLVEDVLNFAKIEAGSVAFRTEAVPLSVALVGVEAMVAPQFSARGLSYVVRAPSPEITVRADPEKLEQVMLNLLSNAVKFTESGTVEVSAEAREGNAYVAVRDTGIGVPADKLELIFDPFYQVQSGYTRRASGTGLGLAISRDLARRMGGDLSVTSTTGLGSTFVLRLPLEP
ncbi:MAG TPA: HAMP domain-containing sensor histidine kinase, partial [Gemmatimonadaceae bacterium]|nr:HAMP domain-containing sensor histidine kinase [Gemmatimonadaceae bacterium]